MAAARSILRPNLRTNVRRWQWPVGVAVVPAKAGTAALTARHWVPAFAGTTASKWHDKMRGSHLAALASMPKHATPEKEFEPEFIAALVTLFEERIPFNHVLGLKIASITPQRSTGRLDMRHELVGHYAYNRIHGGVISAGLDAMAGLAVM